MAKRLCLTLSENILRSKKVIILRGPTASGKSKFALSLANKLNGEIINADSMQVYKEFSVLSSRPSKSDTKRVKHYLYGHKNGSERYNVATWCEEAVEKIIECQKNNITPIIVGGTGMYIEKLINGIVDIPSIPEEYKLKSEKKLARENLQNSNEIETSTLPPCNHKMYHIVIYYLDKNLQKHFQCYLEIYPT